MVEPLVALLELESVVVRRVQLQAGLTSLTEDSQIGSCVLKLTKPLTKLLVTVIVRCGVPTLSSPNRDVRLRSIRKSVVAS